MMDGVPIIDPAKVPGVLYFVPIGKSPHGMDVDPSGKWIVAGGKLQPATTVLNFEKVQAAINNKTFEGDFRGIPILKYEAVVEGEVPVGLGPLHTQYDGKGIAYTSMFIDSNITKWKLPPWTDEEKKDLNKAVLDKVPGAFQHRPPRRGGQRHEKSVRQMAGRNEQAVGRPPHQCRTRAAGVEPVDRHQRRQNENDR